MFEGLVVLTSYSQYAQHQSTEMQKEELRGALTTLVLVS